MRGACDKAQNPHSVQGTGAALALHSTDMDQITELTRRVYILSIVQQVLSLITIVTAAVLAVSNVNALFSGAASSVRGSCTRTAAPPCAFLSQLGY